MTRDQLKRVVRTTGTVSMSAFEAYVLAEILWAFLHNGQTLHGAVGEYLGDLRDRVAHAKQVRDTLRNIRDLPEQ